MNTVLIPISEYVNKLENADNNEKNKIEKWTVNGEIVHFYLLIKTRQNCNILVE